MVDVVLFVVALVPAALAGVLVRSRGWSPRRWSAREQRLRAGLALLLGVAFAVAGYLVVVVGAWLLGPDCGASAGLGTRIQLAGFGLVVAVGSAAIPVAVAGQRRLAMVAGGMPLATSLVVGIAAATSNAPGWCLF